MKRRSEGLGTREHCPYYSGECSDFGFDLGCP